MSGFSKAYLRKSQADRRCDYYSCKIKKGDYYIYFSGVYDHRWAKERRCIECAYKVKTKSTEYLRQEIEELWNEYKNRSIVESCNKSNAKG